MASKWKSNRSAYIISLLPKVNSTSNVAHLKVAIFASDAENLISCIARRFISISSNFALANRIVDIERFRCKIKITLSTKFMCSVFIRNILMSLTCLCAYMEKKMKSTNTELLVSVQVLQSFLHMNVIWMCRTSLFHMKFSTSESIFSRFEMHET